MNENPPSNTAWEDRLTWFKSSPEYRALDRIDGEPREFEWNIFPGFITLQLCNKVRELLSRLSVEAENFTGRVMQLVREVQEFLSKNEYTTMFNVNDILLTLKENEKQCE